MKIYKGACTVLNKLDRFLTAIFAELLGQSRLIVVSLVPKQIKKFF